MSAKTNRKPFKPFENGTLVTVMVTDAQGDQHAFHGRFVGISDHLTQAVDRGRGTEYIRYADEEVLRPELGEPSPYARIYSATGKEMSRGTLAHTGPDHWFDLFGIHVRTDSPNVTITKATKEGRTWVQANLSIEHRRDLFIEQVKAMDPKLAQSIDDLMYEIDEAAYERGKDAEWRSTHF